MFNIIKAILDILDTLSRVGLSHMKNETGDCWGQTSSRYQENVWNIQVSVNAWVEEAGHEINSTVDITCFCLQHIDTTTTSSHL